MRNARQAVETVDGGDVRVTAARSGQSVCIDVADTGPGLTAAACERLFQPFASVGRARGTGLGLLIARELAHCHDGDLLLVKSDSSGTTFRLQLPDR